jgi:hypothetical protein
VPVVETRRKILLWSWTKEQTLRSLQGDSYRERFIERATEAGIPFSEEVLRPQARSFAWLKLRRRTSFFFVFAGATAAVIFVVAFQSLRSTQQSPATLQAVAPISVPSDDGKAKLIAELQAKIEDLEKQTQAQKQIIANLHFRAKNSESDSAKSRLELADANERLSRLQVEAGGANRALTATKLDLASARSAKNDEDAALVEQQYKLTALAEQLKMERAAGERDRQLSQAVSDVRDLMGARNLHIIDVSDVDGDGKAKKAFGRVYLTEGKSLIFYEFDLSHKGNAAKVSFQAWGQWEGQNRLAQNLGVFRIDDEQQRRWVLKVDDPEKLKNVNTLFVTVETLGGADRPTGKRLLYAYFGLQPNHP